MCCNIRGKDDLTDEEQVNIIRMMEECFEINKPEATATEGIVIDVFSLVFMSQWIAKWPPSPPVEKDRRIEHVSVQIGVWTRDLPSSGPMNEEEEVEGQDLDFASPRKRARKSASAQTVFPPSGNGAIWSSLVLGHRGAGRGRMSR